MQDKPKQQDSQADKQQGGLTYQGAGVNIDAGEALVERIKPAAARTARPGSNPDLGGFGGLFDLQAAGLKDPVLVAATDGVGTKLEIARAAGLYRGLGIDLVAMCANDILAQGAMPLFFLDYYATGQLDIDQAAEIVAGIADGCEAAGCALIGGETAEMPGVYPKGGFDLAGFCVGAAERGQLLSRNLPQAGDRILALPSFGIHANGFSLVRRIVERSALDWHDPAPFDQSRQLAESLLTPTRIYSRALAAALATGGLHGMAHITGGGLIENPPRVHGQALAMRLDMAARPLPELFCWLEKTGGLDRQELARTFNCGIGALLVVGADQAEEMLARLAEAGEDAFEIGQMEPRSGAAVILDNWFQD